MAKFNQAVMTDKGAELLAKVIAENCGIEFTKIEIGSGVYSDTEKEKEYLKKRENLKDSQKTYRFNSISIKNGNAVSLKTLLTNQDIEKGFRVTEMGVFAKKKDAVGEEVLYSVAVAQEADYLPDKESPIEIIQEYYTTISNAEKVIIKFEQGTYALAEDVNKIQYPEYAESSDLRELEEKESIFTALGKIKTAVKNLIMHINDKNNPHLITKKQLGLENVNNTSDEKKPVSEATQIALDKYYSQLTAYTDKEIADLIGGAPTTMDTLKEVADAIAENKSIQEALDAAIGTKADKEEFDSHAKNKNNPHGVTKAQVGLENVPNVSTNNQTPTFTQAATRSNLASGEKMSVTFGKITKWFADLKTGAFATVTNNDTTTAAGYVADARAVKVHGDEIDNLNSALLTHKSGTDHDGRYYTKWESDDSVQYLSKQINSQYETFANRLMPTAGLAVITGASGGYAYCDKYDRIVVTRICLSVVNKTGAFTNYSLANLPYTANGLAVGLVTSQNKGITFPVTVSEKSNVLVLENKAVTPASDDWLWGNIVYISK